MNIYYILILVTLILLFIILLFYQKIKLVKKIEKAQDKKSREEQMRELVQKYIRKGFTKEEIRLELREKEWPEETIQKLLR